MNITIKVVGIIGAGTMGSALAQKFAQEGFTVILADRAIDFVEKGINNIKSSLQEGFEKKVFTEDQVKKTLENIVGTANIEDLKNCDLVVEAIFEDFDAKIHLFKHLSKVVSDTCIIATNTSSFSVNELSEYVKNRERFIGLHFFYHAAKNRLVEIIPNLKTSPQVFEAAKRFAFLAGKDAIYCKDSYGFVVNRFFVPWLNEACRLLEDNIGNIPTIDAVCMEKFGIGMGPFALMNATGVPIACHSQKTLEVYGELYKTSEKLIEQTELNQAWNLEAEIITDENIRNEIADRMLGIEFLVCTQLLDEKICSATDINRGARIGLKWKAGPIELMNKYGEQESKRLIEKTALKYNTMMPLSIGKGFWKQEFVTYEKYGRNAIITMSRPEDLNALNEDVMNQLLDKFAKANMDMEIEQIFLRGSGKAFVAGADIKFFVKNMKARSIDNIERFTRFGQEVFELIDHSSKKVIAILNGLALGGGLELALCADLIFALPGASMSFPETGIGIYPGLGGTQRSTRRIGKALSKYLIHTGKMLSAKDAFEIGLVDQVITVDEMYGFMYGNLPLPSPTAPVLNERWLSVKNFFEDHTLNELLTHQVHDTMISKEESDRICKTMSFKAPLALHFADKLIDDAKGCADELIYLPEIFKTQDALLGLTSIGQKVSYKGE